jgi:hypothetical protein
MAAIKGQARLLRARSEAPFLMCEECGGEDIGWSEFVEGVAELMSCHCCGGALAGSTASFARRKPAPLRDPTRWRDHPAAKAPELPTTHPPYLIPDVTVVREDGLHPHQDVLVENDRIAAVAPAGKTAHGPTVVEACRGLFVSPSLIDLHVHMPPWNVFRLTRLFLLLTLRHGVTIVRDAGDTDGSATPAVLALVRSGKMPGPETHYAYAFVGRGAKRWANTADVDVPEDAKPVVSWLAGLGASWIKSYENLTPAHIAALVHQANAHRMGVMGHVPTALTCEDAAIPDTQHYFGVPPPASLRRDHVLERHIAWEAVDQKREDLVIRASVERGIAHTPTHTTLSSLLVMNQDRDARFARAGDLPGFYPSIIWDGTHGLPPYRGLSQSDFDRIRRALDAKLRLTKRLAEAGASLRLGTDIQQPFTVPGAALLEEMSLFRQAGISGADVWRRATREAAKVLGLADCGFVDRGARADFIVTTHDARSRIERRDIVAVAAKGALTMASDLDAEIAREKSRFDGVVADHVSRWLARFALNRLARRFTN